MSGERFGAQTASPVIRRKSFGSKDIAKAFKFTLDENNSFPSDKIEEQLSILFFTLKKRQQQQARLRTLLKTYTTLFRISQTIEDANAKDDLPSLTKLAMLLFDKNFKDPLASLLKSLCLAEVFFIYRPFPPYSDDNKVTVFEAFVSSLKHLSAVKAKVKAVPESLLDMTELKDFPKTSLKDSQALALLLLEKIANYRLFLIIPNLKLSKKTVKEELLCSVVELLFDLFVKCQDRDLDELIFTTLYEIICEVKHLHRYTGVLNLLLKYLVVEKEDTHLFQSFSDVKKVSRLVQELVLSLAETSAFSEVFERAFNFVYGVFAYRSLPNAEQVEVLKPGKNQVLGCLTKKQRQLLLKLAEIDESYVSNVLPNVLKCTSDEDVTVRKCNVEVLAQLFLSESFLSNNFSDFCLLLVRIQDVDKGVRLTLFTLVTQLLGSRASFSDDLNERLTEFLLFKKQSFLCLCFNESAIVEEKFQLLDALFELLGSVLGNSGYEKHLTSLWESLVSIMNESNFRNTTYLMRKLSEIATFGEGLDKDKLYSFYKFDKYRLRTVAEINCFKIMKLKVFDISILSQSTQSSPTERLERFMRVYNAVSPLRRRYFLLELFERREYFRSIFLKLCTLKLDSETQRPALFRKLTDTLWKEFLTPYDCSQPWLVKEADVNAEVNLVHQLFELKGVDDVFELLKRCAEFDISDLHKVKKAFKSCMSIIKRRIETTKFVPVFKQMIHFLSLQTLGEEALAHFFNAYVVELVADSQALDRWLEVADDLFSSFSDLLQKKGLLSIDTLTTLLGSIDTEGVPEVLTRFSRFVFDKRPGKKSILLQLEWSEAEEVEMKERLEEKAVVSDSYPQLRALAELSSCIDSRMQGSKALKVFLKELLQQSLSISKNKSLAFYFMKLGFLLNTSNVATEGDSVVLKKICSGLAIKIVKSSLSALVEKLGDTEDALSRAQLLKLASLHLISAVLSLKTEGNSLKAEKKEGLALLRTIVQHEGNPWHKEGEDNQKFFHLLYTTACTSLMQNVYFRRDSVGTKSSVTSSVKEYSLLFKAALENEGLLKDYNQWNMASSKLYFRFSSLIMTVLFLNNKNVLTFDALEEIAVFKENRAIVLKLANNYNRIVKDDKVPEEKQVHSSPEYLITFILYLLSHLPWLETVRSKDLSLVEFKRKESATYVKLKQAVTRVSLQFMSLLREIKKEAKEPSGRNHGLLLLLGYKIMGSTDLVDEGAAVVFEAIGEVFVNVLQKKAKPTSTDILEIKGQTKNVTLPVFYKARASFQPPRLNASKATGSRSSRKRRALTEEATSLQQDSASVFTQGTTVERNKELTTEARVEQYKRARK